MKRRSFFARLAFGAVAVLAAARLPKPTQRPGYRKVAGPITGLVPPGCWGTPVVVELVGRGGGGGVNGRELVIDRPIYIALGK